MIITHHPRILFIIIVFILLLNFPDLKRDIRQDSPNNLFECLPLFLLLLFTLHRVCRSCVPKVRSSFCSELESRRAGGRSESKLLRVKLDARLVLMMPFSFSCRKDDREVQPPDVWDQSKDRTRNSWRNVMFETLEGTRGSSVHLSSWFWERRIMRKKRVQLHEASSRKNENRNYFVWLDHLLSVFSSLTERWCAWWSEWYGWYQVIIIVIIHCSKRLEWKGWEEDNDSMLEEGNLSVSLCFWVSCSLLNVERGKKDLMEIFFWCADSTRGKERRSLSVSSYLLSLMAVCTHLYIICSVIYPCDFSKCTGKTGGSRCYISLFSPSCVSHAYSRRRGF